MNSLNGLFKVDACFFHVADKVAIRARMNVRARVIAAVVVLEHLVASLCAPSLSPDATTVQRH